MKTFTTFESKVIQGFWKAFLLAQVDCSGLRCLVTRRNERNDCSWWGTLRQARGPRTFSDGLSSLQPMFMTGILKYPEFLALPSSR